MKGIILIVGIIFLLSLQLFGFFRLYISYKKKKRLNRRYEDLKKESEDITKAFKCLGFKPPIDFSSKRQD